MSRNGMDHWFDENDPVITPNPKLANSLQDRGNVLRITDNTTLVTKADCALSCMTSDAFFAKKFLKQHVVLAHQRSG